MERAMATCAISTALRRHAGHYAEVADPVMGIMAGAAMGRDLRNVERLVWAASSSTRTRRRLLGMVEHSLPRAASLLPLNLPKVILDRSYLLYVMAVLGKHYDAASSSRNMSMRLE